MVRWRLLLAGLIVVGGWASSCSPADFQSSTVIDGVRILASRARPSPRVTPGTTVTLDLLAYDGRVAPVGTMKLSWLKLPCINPANDAYFACFATLAAGGGDAGVLLGAGGSADADASAGAGAGAGADAGAGAGAGALAPLLVTESSVTFKMPEDVIIQRTGVTPSYGLAILFNFACTGTLKLLPYDPNSSNPQQIPVGCFDANGNQLGAQDFVFGFTRVYAYDTTNEVNPVIQDVDIGGPPPLELVDGGPNTKPFVVPLCGESDGGTICEHAIGPVVGASPPANKQVWADFYSTVGTFSSEAKLLFDPTVTLSIPGGTNNKYSAPATLLGAPKNNLLWIVVHDDQGGADWAIVPLQFTSPDADGGPAERDR